MLDLGDLMVFTKVVETESLTKAGKLLGLPKSTVSRRVSRLEEHLGAQWLYRSTRADSVTQDRALFFQYCLRSMGVLRDGERACDQQPSQGLVRGAIPYVLGHTLSGPLSPTFSTPIRRTLVRCQRRRVNCCERLDLALAVGPLAGSDWSRSSRTTDAAPLARPAISSARACRKAISSCRDSTCSRRGRSTVATNGGCTTAARK